MKRFCGLAIIAVVLASVNTPAHAIPAFNTYFKKTFVETSKNEAFVKAVKNALRSA